MATSSTSAPMMPDTPATARIAAARLVRRSYRLLIDGQWRDAASGETFSTVDPTTEQALASVAAGDTEDVSLAVSAARRALDAPVWCTMRPADRSRMLLRIADQMEVHASELAALDSLDMGAPIAFTTGMVATAVEAFRYYAGWPTKILGATHPTVPSQFTFTVREPVGVCGGITPWNAPILMAAWKIAPALACGNSVILKPAEQAPLSSLRLGELILEAGVPDGLVNIVTGFGPTAGAAIVEHPGVDKVAFTGSGEVGKAILQASAGNLKRVTLELGGKSPTIVLADANLDEAAAAAAAGFLNNSGQICAAGTRIFVDETIRDKFADKLLQRTREYRLGDPFDPTSRMGPLVSRAQYDRVSQYLELGRTEGAIARTGGEPLEGTGYFVPPTVFDDVDNRMRIAQEEIFGPVAALIAFREIEHAIAQANETQYGLAAAVWTRDLSAAHRVARAIKAGTVNINGGGPGTPGAPFGGYKQSGIGREMGPQALDHYTEIKTINIRL